MNRNNQIDDFEVEVCEKSNKRIKVHFKNSNKNLVIHLRDGTQLADVTGLDEDVPGIEVETSDNHIMIDTPGFNDLT